MRILFDQGTPAPLRGFLAEHEVVTAYERGWDKLQNGNLLRAAEVAGFEIFISTDQSLRYQQNLAGRRLATIVLPTTSWPLIRTHVLIVTKAVAQISAGAYVELSFPLEAGKK